MVESNYTRFSKSNSTDLKVSIVSIRLLINRNQIVNIWTSGIAPWHGLKLTNE